jgi:hypothetical protein
MTKSTVACNRADRFVADTRRYTNPYTLANAIFAMAEPEKLQVFAELPTHAFSSWQGAAATGNCKKDLSRNNILISTG